MKEDLKNIFLMGLGAMSMTSDKALELKEDLKKKGQLAYQRGVIVNEELKHNLKDKMKDNVTVVVENMDKEEILRQIESLSDTEKKEIIDALTNKKMS